MAAAQSFCAHAYSCMDQAISSLCDVKREGKTLQDSVMGGKATKDGRSGSSGALLCEVCLRPRLRRGAERAAHAAPPASSRLGGPVAMSCRQYSQAWGVAPASDWWSRRPRGQAVLCWSSKLDRTSAEARLNGLRLAKVVGGVSIHDDRLFICSVHHAPDGAGSRLDHHVSSTVAVVEDKKNAFVGVERW